MKIKIACMLALLAFINILSAQTDGDYRSKSNGNWTNVNTWQRYYAADPAGWKDYDVNTYPFAYPVFNNANVVTVLQGHSVTVNADMSVDQVVVNGILIVGQNRILTVQSNSSPDLFVSSIGRLELNGLVNNFGSLIVDGFIKDNNGQYVFGSGSFVLNDEATLETKSGNGIRRFVNPNYFGFVQTSGSTFLSTQANYIFSSGIETKLVGVYLLP